MMSEPAYVPITNDLLDSMGGEEFDALVDALWPSVIERVQRGKVVSMIHLRGDNVLPGAVYEVLFTRNWDGSTTTRFIRTPKPPDTIDRLT